jgi:hypothetical protein
MLPLVTISNVAMQPVIADIDALLQHFEALRSAERTKLPFKQRLEWGISDVRYMVCKRQIGAMSVVIVEITCVYLAF